MSLLQRLSAAQSPLVMGILNTTPDSFSDGGRHNSFDAALRHAERMLAEGAHIIDVGGESTRPGAPDVSVAEELDRVVPVVEGLRSRFDTLISVDTSAPEVMVATASLGIDLINDVRSLTRPGALAAAVASGLPVCIMHMQGEPRSMQQNPEYQDVVAEVAQWLKIRADECMAAGIKREHLLIDPGFGFGKTAAHNYRLLNELASLQKLGMPLLTGLSRKRMIGDATGIGVAADRVNGSVAGAVICAMKGAAIVRVHDVRETAEAMKVVAATLGEQHV
ncbi:dihydropteroate synthase [Parathalassolituus penaei]|uniref:Dihydropteroate synthase n=1 Tax=Parathalassolituus penaei TaxID=2997323 RepID=A0A9X3IUH3_9GAMM|nr:dihydropteroate synthase [Parathalassolituus penaei]MCY0966969.1 dihydropteroate synthase [Parathalassolituus penaei]